MEIDLYANSYSGCFVFPGFAYQCFDWAEPLPAFSLHACFPVATGLLLTVFGAYLMLVGQDSHFLSSNNGHLVEVLCLALGVALYVVGMLLPGRRVSVRISTMSQSERVRPGFSLRILSVMLGLLVVSSCFSAFALLTSGSDLQCSVIEPEDILVNGSAPLQSREEKTQQQFERFFGIHHKMAHNPAALTIRTQ